MLETFERVSVEKDSLTARKTYLKILALNYVKFKLQGTMAFTVNRGEITVYRKN